MKELRKIIGENLATLRKNKKMTQLELAERLGYSDKAISKWENGDTLPDIEILYQLCRFYGFTLDYLTYEENIEKKATKYVVVNPKQRFLHKLCITGLVISIVWIIATIIYVYLLIYNQYHFWQAFIWAVPVSCFLLLVINRIHFRNRLMSFWTLTIANWSLITGFYLQFLHYNLWPLFLICIPIQVALILWLGIAPTNKSNN